MEENKTIIDKVRALIFEEETPIVEEAKFLDATTTEGVAIKVVGESLEVGAAVTVVDENGEESIAPEGSHTLEDGTTIIVDAEGNISEITEATTEEVEEEVEEEMATEELNPLEEKVNALEGKLEEILAKFNEVSTKVEEFAKLPAEEEVVVKKADIKVSKKYSALDEIAKFRSKK
jgi:hypothetical protein